MIARFLTVWQWIKSSLWALPLLMVVVAAGAAIAALQVRIASDASPVWWLFSGGAKQTPSFLGHLVSAMITMGTLVISITMVVLTLAAQQLGPRLIHSFMADRRTQAAIGLFVATIVYLLVVLRSVYGENESVANLAVTIGTALVLISVVTLPLFVHHLARSIVADIAIERVGHALDGWVRSVLPEDAAAPDRPRSATDEISIRRNGMPVRSERSGYVQTIDHGQLVACARQLRAVIELAYRPGQHVIVGAVLGWINPPPEDVEAGHDALAGSIVLGSERTPVQDIEYSLRQLVEIALRALSPGINDPYTAIVVIDRLAASIGLMLKRGAAEDMWFDEDGAIRLIAPASTLAGIVDAAFNQIRQVGAQHPAVLIHLAHTLRQLSELTDGDRREVLQTHLGLVLETGRDTIHAEYDGEALWRHAAPTSDKEGP